jgi:L-iditol 2-dehydrogenase
VFSVSSVATLVKALQKIAEGPGNLALRDVQEPAVEKDEVKIAVRAGGICGTDMHIRDGGYGSNPPVTLGHEICGDVVEVGTNVSHIQIGDRVTVNPTANNTCGQCRYCHVGTYFFCENRKSIGSGVDGGFAEYLTAPAPLTFALPDTTSYDAGAMTEPFACCVKAVCRMTSISPGNVVLICGPGPIGLMCAWLAKQAGATTVVAGTGVDGDRLKAAASMGVEAVNVESTDVVELLRSLSNGYGADAVIDCGGTRGSVNQCLQAAANGGQFTQVALIDHPFEIDWGRVVYKQLRVQGSIASDWPSWDQAIHLVRSCQVDLEQFVSHRHAIDDWEVAFGNAEEKVGLKQILTP